MVKSHAMDQIRKPRITAKGIEVGMHFDHLQKVGPILVGLLKSGKCLLVIAESQISVHKCGGGDLAFLLFSFQPIEQS